MKTLKSKRFWFYSSIILLLCLGVTTFKATQSTSPPPEKITKTEIEPLLNGVLSGKIIGAEVRDQLAEIVLVIKDNRYTLLVSNKAEIISILPRIQHTVDSLVKWIKENPECGGTFGIEKGVVTGVIVTTID